MHILLVQSDPVTATTLREWLGAAEHEVSSAQTGAAALRLFHEGHPRPEGLVVELALPDMTGWAVVEACRAIVAGLPAVITSPDPETDFRVHHFAIMLQTPCSEEELLRALWIAARGEPSP